MTVFYAVVVPGVRWFNTFVPSAPFFYLTYLADWPETLRKPCLSTNFPHQEIK